jgi:hypothetical protein
MFLKELLWQVTDFSTTRINLELCEYLSKKIITLDISIYFCHSYIQSKEIHLFRDTFLNLERPKP